MDTHYTANAWYSILLYIYIPAAFLSILFVSSCCPFPSLLGLTLLCSPHSWMRVCRYRCRDRPGTCTIPRNEQEIGVSYLRLCLAAHSPSAPCLLPRVMLDRHFCNSYSPVQHYKVKSYLFSVRSAETPIRSPSSRLASVYPLLACWVWSRLRPAPRTARLDSFLPSSRASPHRPLRSLPLRR